MRGALKYGVPIAAGLGTGAYALSQGEDPGSAALAAGAGALGGAAGLLGGRLAGKYSPKLLEAIQEKAVVPVGNIVGNIGRNLPDTSTKRAAVVGKAADILAAAEGAAMNPAAQRTVGKLTAGLGVPAAALTAGLGGVALGAIPGSLGVPGFQQETAVDPEAYGSSNSMGARYKAPTMQYM
jgi:hypothetical protein